LANNYAPASYQSLHERPTLLGVGIGAFLLTSLIVQTLLTRKAPSKKQESKDKS
jgi:hydrogenase-4 membrane subunit HyfE